MPKGNKPDYTVHVLDRNTDRRGKVGVAWKNDDESISLVLDPCVVLEGNNLDITIRLFSREETERRFGRRGADHQPATEDFDTGDRPPY